MLRNFTQPFKIADTLRFFSFFLSSFTHFPNQPKIALIILYHLYIYYYYVSACWHLTFPPNSEIFQLFTFSGLERIESFIHRRWKFSLDQCSSKKLQSEHNSSKRRDETLWAKTSLYASPREQSGLLFLLKWLTTTIKRTTNQH